MCSGGHKYYPMAQVKAVDIKRVHILNGIQPFKCLENFVTRTNEVLFFYHQNHSFFVRLLLNNTPFASKLTLEVPKESISFIKTPWYTCTSISDDFVQPGIM